MGEVFFVGVFEVGGAQAGHQVFHGGQAFDGAVVQVGEGCVWVDEENGFWVLIQWGVLGHFLRAICVFWTCLLFRRQTKLG